MKLKNKILSLALALAFVPMTTDFSSQSVSYAAEETVNTIENQRAELQKAVDASVKIVNSEVYFSYASQGLKSEYEAAISDGELQLSRQDATYEDLRLATKRINDAVDAIYKEAEGIAQKIKVKKDLEKAISDNQLQVQVVNSLIKNYPKTIQRVRPQLLKMIEESNAIVKEAQALLKTL